MGLPGRYLCMDPPSVDWGETTHTAPRRSVSCGGVSVRILRVDDYQSWLVETGSTRVLIDPWLTSQLSLPPGPWMFCREHAEAPAREALALRRPDLLIITAHFGDHLIPESLRRLDAATPTITTRAGARMLRRLGFTDVTVATEGHHFPIGAGAELRILAPGFPYRHNSLGLLFSEGAHRLYLETHVTPPRPDPALDEGVDLLVADLESVRLFGVPITIGAHRVLETLRQVPTRAFMPTGVEPARATGLLRHLLRIRGDWRSFPAQLAAAGLQVPMLAPAVGEAVVIGGSAAPRITRSPEPDTLAT